MVAMPKKTKIDKSEIEALATMVLTKRTSIGNAASELGWSPTKAYRISRTPQYRATFAQKTLEMCDTLMSQTILAAEASFAVLVQLLQSPRDDIRLGSARTLISQLSASAMVATKQLEVAQNEIRSRKQKGDPACTGMCQVFANLKPRQDRDETDDEIDQLLYKTRTR